MMYVVSRSTTRRLYFLYSSLVDAAALLPGLTTGFDLFIFACVVRERRIRVLLQVQ